MTGSDQIPRTVTRLDTFSDHSDSTGGETIGGGSGGCRGVRKLRGCSRDCGRSGRSRPECSEHAGDVVVPIVWRGLARVREWVQCVADDVTVVAVLTVRSCVGRCGKHWARGCRGAAAVRGSTCLWCREATFNLRVSSVLRFLTSPWEMLATGTTLCGALLLTVGDSATDICIGALYCELSGVVVVGCEDCEVYPEVSGVMRVS